MLGGAEGVSEPGQGTRALVGDHLPKRTTHFFGESCPRVLEWRVAMVVDFDHRHDMTSQGKRSNQSPALRGNTVIDGRGTVTLDGRREPRRRFTAVFTREARPVGSVVLPHVRVRHAVGTQCGREGVDHRSWRALGFQGCNGVENA